MADPKYQLVEFIEETPGMEKTVAVVPSDWIDYDEENHILVTKFMPPPYKKDTIETFLPFVRYCMPPSENWPTFPIQLREQARNYKEAQQKLKCVDKKHVVFTSDEDMTAKRRAEEATDKYVRVKRFASLRSEDRRVSALHFESGESTLSQRSNRSAPSSIQGKASDVTVKNEPQDEPQDVFDNVIVSAYPTINDFTENIKNVIKEGLLPIEKQLKELTREIRSLRAEYHFVKLNNMQQPDSLSWQEHGFDLPFKGQDEFEEFEHAIHNDEDRKEKIKLLIWQNVDTSSTPIDSIRRVLKIFLTPALIKTYTAVKETKSKKVFAKTKFFAELQTILIKKYLQSDKLISCKDIEKSVGKIFNAAKDWNGARQARKRMKIGET